MEEFTDHMGEAIAEARRAMGHTHPNPAVGAVILHDGEPVARGATQPAGEDHAEIVALKQFKERGLIPDESTTLLVTMEPCSTQGRTGPCTAAIIASGIRNVIIGTTDPNPAHAGRGVRILEEAGVHVVSGFMNEACADLNLIFNWQMAEGTPFFAGKIATTIDGRIATRGGMSKWITGEAARQDVHFWRRYFPAIAVGAGTVLADDPALTVRLEGEPESCPIRFVFDRNLVTFKDGLPQIYADAWRGRTILLSSRAHAERIKTLEGEHRLRVWLLDTAAEDGGLAEFADRCRTEGIHGVLIEGGSQLLSSFLRHRRLHYLFAYRSPKLLADASSLPPFTGMEPASMADTVSLREVRHACFGDDQLMRGFVVYP